MSSSVRTRSLEVECQRQALCYANPVVAKCCAVRQGLECSGFFFFFFGGEDHIINEMHNCKKIKLKKKLKKKELKKSCIYNVCMNYLVLVKADFCQMLLNDGNYKSRI